MSKSNRNIIAAALASTALCAAGQAFAQSADQTGIETVVVTAAKRAENIQDVPSSVSAVSEQLINRIQANNISDIASYVPGLNVQPEGVDANRLIIRGLTTGPNDISPSVGVYLDDAPFGSNSGYALGALFSPDVDPYDLDHVEVLRGPQGTLYGASTIGGLVKFVTKAPDPDNFEGHLRADLDDDSGDTGTISEAIRAGLNIPIVNDEVGLRISGFYQNSPGDIANERTGQSDLNGFKKDGGRADLQIKPNGAWTIDLVAVYDHSDVPHVGVITGSAQTLQPTYNRHAGYDYVDGYADSTYDIFEGNIKYEFENGITASSTTAWSHFAVKELADDTATFAPAFGPLGSLFEFAGPVQPTTNKLTEELRLASPSSDRFEWMVGFYYDHEDSNYLSGIDSTYLFGATPPPVLQPTVDLLANYETVDSIERYIEEAGFANVSYHITPDLEVGAGLRYSHNDQHLTSEGSGYLALLGLIPTLATPTSSDNVLTESFDASWHFDPDAMIYARAARGYRPGGPNITGTSFAPDTTWNYEVGLKGTALDGKLSGDIDAFYIDWTNIQLNFFNGTVTEIGNAGDAISKGVEMEGSYTPIDGLTFSGNLDYTDAYISKLIPGATGGAVVGNVLPFDSKWSGALKADYYFPAFDKFTANVGASLRYKSSFDTTFPGDTGTRFYTLPSETFFDLRAGLAFDNYELDLQVLNVANNRVLNAASEYLAVPTAVADAAGQPVDLGYASGRTFGLSLTARF
jgi:outer membrane receptor protein involved in Fe transport